MVTVLTEAGATEVVSAQATGDDLWFAKTDVTRATGWNLKPEGLCQGDLCVPVPKANSENFVREETVNIAGFWRLLGRPALHDQAGATWMLGASASDRANALQSLEAPDFKLPDLDGKLHSLSDYRGKRVFLTTWSSW
ncbi:MAG: redoxin domain-containing protein [Gammaproteobacteria bacterium]|nr:redoxin domain-containing protein [Gammaproteobacteria bacterium]